MLKHLPAQRAEGVADVDGDKGNSEKDWVGAAQRVEKLLATKIAEMKEPTRPIRNKPQDTKPNNRDEKLPR